MEGSIPFSKLVPIVSIITTVFLISKMQGGFQYSVHYLFIPLYATFFSIIWSKFRHFYTRMKVTLDIEEGVEQADVEYSILLEKIDMVNTAYKAIISMVFI